MTLNISCSGLISRLLKSQWPSGVCNWLSDLLAFENIRSVFDKKSMDNSQGAGLSKKGLIQTQQVQLILFDTVLKFWSLQFWSRPFLRMSPQQLGISVAGYESRAYTFFLNEHRIQFLSWLFSDLAFYEDLNGKTLYYAQIFEYRAKLINWREHEAMPLFIGELCHSVSSNLPPSTPLYIPPCIFQCLVIYSDELFSAKF